MYRLAILLVYLRSGQTMSPITKYLLTPLKEQGEFCGYESCPMTINGVLNIHVIPYTHGELGYTRTFDNHFTGHDDLFDKSNINMKRILDYVISELWANPKRRFAFSELPYLYKWWSIRDGTVKRMVYQLIRQGRLQFVGGGWSMTDEATAEYQAIIDHFTYSLRKLNATFLDCARPLVTWQSDVFGHTNEFASLMAQMGFDGHFISPISYDDELERMRTKRLEFIWQGSQDLGVSSEIFTHKLFDGYWSPPGFCFGGQCSDPLIVTSNSAFNNVMERVKLFVEAMEYRQRPHYATNHLVVIMGQRFGYYDAPIWFDNIDRLIRSVNQYVTSNKNNMFMYYSTPACYLKAVYESNSSFTMESDDFVPVAYDKNTHFSGIFTSRPTVKYAARQGNIYLQITKQLQVLAKLAKNDQFFEDFHWIMGVLQDHNILSGGMRPFVRDYYVNIIYKTLQSSERVIRDGLIKLMETPKIGYKRCLFNISYCEYTNQDNFHIVVYNPLAWNVTVPVRLPVDEGRFTVFLPNLEQVQSVIMKIPRCIQDIPYKRKHKYNYELVFLAEYVPAFGYRSYFIEKISRMRRSVLSNVHFTKEGVQNDEFGDLNNDEVKSVEIAHSDDSFNHDKVKNDELDSTHSKKHHMIMRSVDPKDHFNSDRAVNDNFYNINDHVSNMYDKNDNIHDLISRKIRSLDYKDNFTNQKGKNDRIDDIYGSLRNNRAKNYEFLKLHHLNRNIRNLNSKVYGEVKPNFEILKDDKKNDKPNADWKRMFESINNEPDNIELDIVFGSARKTENDDETNKTNTILDLNKSINDLDTKDKYGNEKYDEDVTEYILDSLKEYNTSKPNSNATNIDSDYSNKDFNEKAKIDRQKHCKNKNGNILQGLKRCNCKNGRLKREHIEKNSEEITNDTIDQSFGNKTLRFIHLKQDDQIPQKQNVTKDIKREIKYLKQNKEEKIKDLKRVIKNPKLKIKDTKHHVPKDPKPDEIKDLKHVIKNPKLKIKDNKHYGPKDPKPDEIKNLEHIIKNLKRKIKDTKHHGPKDPKPDEIKDLKHVIKYLKSKIKDTKHHETKDTKPDQIKDLKHVNKNLKRKIKDNKHHETKDPKPDEIKDLKREIQELKREIQDLTKTKRMSKETRPERSIFKKIKNAQKKYLRRQTNNLKIDDESLLNSDHHFDNDDDDDGQEDEYFENTTEGNERYVFEHVTDVIDYIVTPKSRSDFFNPVEVDTKSTTTTTMETTKATTKATTKETTTEATTETATEATTETTTAATVTTEEPDTVISTLYSDTTDSYISNDYINITTDVHKNISHIALANGLTMVLNINFYYFASDDPMRMGRADYKKPGAFVFRPMDPEPVFIAQKPKIEVYKSNVVEEIHSNSEFVSFVIRLYKNAPFIEVEWIVREIPISDGIGKEVFIRYNTDLETNGVFYTDSNGRQTMKRVYGRRAMYTPAAPDGIPGNYYPVISKITIEDPQKLIRFSVFNDRTQGGSSFNGEIDLMLNRRILTDDAGFQGFINETEDEIGTTVSGKHYIYITKLNTKINKIFEKKLAKEIGLKPQVFVSNKMVDKYQWQTFQNEFIGVKKIPIGLNIVTLQEWNDGSYLLRIENYLEKSDIIKSGIKKIVLQDLFTVFRITNVRETTLAGNIFIEDFVPLNWKTRSSNTEKLPLRELKVNEELFFKPQQIRTFIIWVEFYQH